MIPCVQIAFDPNLEGFKRLLGRKRKRVKRHEELLVSREKRDEVNYQIIGKSQLLNQKNVLLGRIESFISLILETTIDIPSKAFISMLVV